MTFEEWLIKSELTFEYHTTQGAARIAWDHQQKIIEGLESDLEKSSETNLRLREKISTMRTEETSLVVNNTSLERRVRQLTADLADGESKLEKIRGFQPLNQSYGPYWASIQKILGDK